MKTSRKAFFGAILVSLMFFFSVNSLYAADCSSATIKRIGSNPTAGVTGASPYVVQLDCLNDAVWAGVVQFYLSEDLGDAGLAQVLTAYSLDKKLWVRTLGETGGSLISILYIND